MPVVGADPVGGSFAVMYDNQSGTQAASATVAIARYIMNKGQNTLTWSFSVTPTGSGQVAPGTTRSVTHTKTPGSGTGQGAQTPCSYCGGTGELQVQWKSGGKTFGDALQPVNILCAL
jgi:DnaJ-class molecular chaperone